MNEEQWQTYIDETANFFDRVHSSEGLLQECNRLADTLEEIAYEDDWESFLDFFTPYVGGKSRVTSDGEFESEFVYLAYGGPWISLDTATGEISGHWYQYKASAYLSNKARQAINEFFRSIYDC